MDTYAVVSQLKKQEDSKRIAKDLGKNSIDGIILNGDIGTKHPTTKWTAEEFEKTLTPLCELGVPIYAQPGSEERKRDFSQSIKRMQEQYNNVFSTVNKRKIAGDSHNLVFLPGCEELRTGDYQLNTRSLEQLIDDNRTTTLVTYTPPRFQGEAVDQVYLADGPQGEIQLQEKIVENITTLYGDKNKDEIRRIARGIGWEFIKRNKGSQRLKNSMARLGITKAVSSQFPNTYAHTSELQHMQEREERMDLNINTLRTPGYTVFHVENDTISYEHVPMHSPHFEEQRYSTLQQQS